eukprot:TRINITY_DN31090_c0_g1_i1.p1 TRINITY_DN31090_c0_g1~~TRINITY_DN31090_c0_g1_i1.p1  ORF type:complete len:370 (+),score=40.98 TRINITY_DN31090_c0_g1_i1:69-1178(+)
MFSAARRLAQKLSHGATTRGARKRGRQGVAVAAEAPQPHAAETHLPGQHLSAEVPLAKDWSKFILPLGAGALAFGAWEYRREQEPERPAWLPKDGPACGQLGVAATKWAITVRQIQQLVQEAKRRPQFRSGMNMHDFINTFVKPWTRGCGCSYSLLVNAQNPLTAKLMVSHTWGEDVEQFTDSLVLWCSTHHISLDTPVWVCSLGLYQCDDGVGPSIADQIQVEPFLKIIESDDVRLPREDLKPHGMVVAHTLTEDLYERLWCVYEMDAAILRSVPVHGAYPPVNLQKLRELLKSEVKTREAKCSCPTDEAMIRALIEGHGGYARLDKQVQQLRRMMFERAEPFMQAEQAYQVVLDSTPWYRKLFTSLE